MKALGFAAACVLGLLLGIVLPSRPTQPVHSEREPLAASSSQPLTTTRGDEGTRRHEPGSPRPQLPGAARDQVLVRDPAAKGYDAARLFATKMDDARGIFEAEPRDAAWANAREARLGEVLQELQKVDPKARVETTCHTGTCRVRIFSRAQYLNNQMAPFPLMCLASAAQPEWGDATADDPHSDFYLMFGDANHDEDGFLNQRATTCEKYREDWLRQAPR